MKAAIVKRVSNWKKLSLAVALMAALTAMSAAASSPEKYNVVWDSPSANADGSMPLGNGETSLNAWVNPTGELVFYIGRTDSWGDNGRLLKLGRVVVTLDPAPPMQPFKQTLSLVDGTMRVVFGEGNESVELDLWVDANHPVVNVDIDSQREIAATARIELWRTEPSALPSVEVGDILFKDPQNRKTVVEPDTILSGRTRDIGWYHRNIKSVGPELTAELQGTAGYERDDPLLHRTFGAIITA